MLELLDVFTEQIVKTKGSVMGVPAELQKEILKFNVMTMREMKTNFPIEEAMRVDKEEIVTLLKKEKDIRVKRIYTLKFLYLILEGTVRSKVYFIIHNICNKPNLGHTLWQKGVM